MPARRREGGREGGAARGAAAVSSSASQPAPSRRPLPSPPSPPSPAPPPPGAPVFASSGALPFFSFLFSPRLASPSPLPPLLPAFSLLLFFLSVGSCSSFVPSCRLPLEVLAVSSFCVPAPGAGPWDCIGPNPKLGSCIRRVFLVSVAGFPIKFLEAEEEVVELGHQEGGSRSLLIMDRSLYERPEKRARLTILDDNDSRVGAHDGGHQIAVNSGQYEQPGLGRGVPPAATGNSPEFYNGYARVVSPAWRDDDKDGHYMFELGENITLRYKIISKMGEGTFGRVLECWDREAQEYVAIKVIRNVQKYRDAAMIEIDVLRALAKSDKTGIRRCVQLKTWFDYRNHVCIVCERLGPSLFDFLRKNNYRPFSADLVREFGRQLLESVAYMHELTLIHTDLKPENILLISSEYIKMPDYKASNTGKHFKRVPKSSEIKLIDFGSATFDNHYHCSVVSTRHYRAPEVILGLGWTYPCDIWSVGCILVELCSGDALFQTHENLEHLAMMERVLGPIPAHMIKRADRRLEKYFKNGRELNWPDGAVSRESIRAVRRLPRLRNLIMHHVDHSGGLLIDLLQGLLKFEPSERLTAKEALKHPFFKESNRRL